MPRESRRNWGHLCWCGSGQDYDRCHRISDNRGPGADVDLDASAFPWAVRPGTVTIRRRPASNVEYPDYAVSGTPNGGSISPIRTPGEIESIRRSCRHAAEVLVHIAMLARPGVTTAQIDDEAFAECTRRGIYPSTLNYYNYPKSICTSVNEVICHGIPDSRPLAFGDIVNLDVTIFSEGMHGDCSATLLVGDVNVVARSLVDTARIAVRAGVRAVRPFRPLSDIGDAIDAVVRSSGYSVVRQFVGHGIGPRFHAGMQVLHHRNRDRQPMLPGMVFTVEPMINAGTPDAVVWSDGWTAVTADLARSAQFEHTVLVTETGVEVLTANSLVPT
jgi:methionyl aminopeptidase